MIEAWLFTGGMATFSFGLDKTGSVSFNLGVFYFFFSISNKLNILEISYGLDQGWFFLSFLIVIAEQ